MLHSCNHMATVGVKGLISGGRTDVRTIDDKTLSSRSDGRTQSVRRKTSILRASAQCATDNNVINTVEAQCLRADGLSRLSQTIRYGCYQGCAFTTSVLREHQCHLI